MGPLEVIAAVCMLAWLIGTTIFPVGGLIHLLLVVAMVIIVIRQLVKPKGA